MTSIQIPGTQEPQRSYQEPEPPETQPPQEGAQVTAPNTPPEPTVTPAGASQEPQDPAQMPQRSVMPPAFAENMQRLWKARADGYAVSRTDDKGRVTRAAIEDPDERMLRAIQDWKKYSGYSVLRPQFDAFLDGGPMPKDWLLDNRPSKSLDTILLERQVAAQRADSPIASAALDYVVGPVGEIAPAFAQVFADTYAGLASFFTDKPVQPWDIKAMVHSAAGGGTVEEARARINALDATSGFGSGALRFAGQLGGQLPAYMAGGGAGAVAKGAGAVGKGNVLLRAAKATVLAPGTIMKAGSAVTGTLAPVGAKVGEAVGAAVGRGLGAVGSKVGLKTTAAGAGKVGAEIGKEAGAAAVRTAGGFGALGAVTESEDRLVGLGIGASAGAAVGAFSEFGKAALRGMLRNEYRALGPDEKQAMDALQKWAKDNGHFPRAGDTQEGYVRSLTSAFVDAGMPGLKGIAVKKAMGYAVQGGIESIGFSTIDFEFWEKHGAAVLSGNVEALKELGAKIIGGGITLGAFHIPLKDVPAKQRRSQVEPQGEAPKPQEPSPTSPASPGDVSDGKTPAMGGSAETGITTTMPPEAQPRTQTPERNRQQVLDKLRGDIQRRLTPLETLGWREVKAEATPEGAGIVPADAPQTPADAGSRVVELPGTPHSYTVTGDTATANPSLGKLLGVKEPLPVATMEGLLEHASLMAALQAKTLPGTEISAHRGIKAVGTNGEKDGVQRTVSIDGTVLESPLQPDAQWKPAESVPMRGKDALEPDQQQVVAALKDTLTRAEDLPQADRAMLSGVVEVLDTVAARNDQSVAETLQALPKLIETLGNAPTPEAASLAIKAAAESLTVKTPEQAISDMVRQQAESVQQATMFSGREPGASGPSHADVTYYTTSREAAAEYSRRDDALAEPNVMEARVDLRGLASEKDVLRVAKERGIALIDEAHPTAYLGQSPKLVEALREAGFRGAKGTDRRYDDQGDIPSVAIFKPKPESRTGEGGFVDVGAAAEAGKKAGKTFADVAGSAIDAVFRDQIRSIEKRGGSPELAEGMRRAASESRTSIGKVLDIVAEAEPLLRENEGAMMQMVDVGGVTKPRWDALLHREVEPASPAEKQVADAMNKALLELWEIARQSGVFLSKTGTEGTAFFERSASRTQAKLPRVWGEGKAEVYEDPAARMRWFEKLAEVNPGLSAEALEKAHQSEISATEIKSPDRDSAIEHIRNIENVPYEFEGKQMLERDPFEAFRRIVAEEASRAATIREFGQEGVPEKQQAEARARLGLNPLAKGTSAAIEQWFKTLPKQSPEFKKQAAETMLRLQGKEPAPLGRRMDTVRRAQGVRRAAMTMLSGLRDIPSMFTEGANWGGLKNMAKAFDAVAKNYPEERKRAERLGTLLHEIGNLNIHEATDPLNKAADMLGEFGDIPGIRNIAPRATERFRTVMMSKVADLVLKDWAENVKTWTGTARDGAPQMLKELDFNAKDSAALIDGTASEALQNRFRHQMVQRAMSRGRSAERSRFSASPLVQSLVDFTGYASKRFYGLAREAKTAVETFRSSDATPGDKAAILGRLTTRITGLVAGGMLGDLLYYIVADAIEGKDGLSHYARDLLSYPGQTITKGAVSGVLSGPLAILYRGLTGSPGDAARAAAQTTVPSNLVQAAFAAAGDATTPKGWLETAYDFAGALGIIPQASRLKSLGGYLSGAAMGENTEFADDAKLVSQFRRQEGVTLPAPQFDKQPAFYSALGQIRDFIDKADMKLSPEAAAKQVRQKADAAIRQALALQPEENVAAAVRGMQHAENIDKQRLMDYVRDEKRFERMMMHDQMISELAEAIGREQGTNPTPFEERLAGAAKIAAGKARNAWNKLASDTVEDAAVLRRQGQPTGTALRDLANRMSLHPDSVLVDDTLGDKDKKRWGRMSTQGQRQRFLEGLFRERVSDAVDRMRDAARKNR